MAAARGMFEVEGRELSLSNLDKVLYPEAGFTKAEVIDYYVRIAPVLLEHLGDRGITMRRVPDGVDAGSFFEKRSPSSTAAITAPRGIPGPGATTRSPPGTPLPLTRASPQACRATVRRTALSARAVTSWRACGMTR